MAVKKLKPAKPPAMVRDYWPRFRRRTIWLTILMQMAATLAIGMALIAGGVTTTTIVFWITIIAILATNIGINLLLVNQLIIPFKDMTSALTHVSGEPTALAPPNPNARHFERDGFKPLLQLIYRLAVGNQPSDKEISKGKSLAERINLGTAFDKSSFGLAILTPGEEILYSNSKVPVTIDKQEQPQLELVYDDDFNLTEWINQCVEQAVHAEKIWQRVSSKPIGHEGRKIYDINASYQKGSEAEVILTFFDRTALYQPEDDDLDFIAFAAHELRGPITVIRGYLDVLGDELEGTLKNDQTELLSRLVVSANRLSSYVNNILNASRYDRRHLKVHLAEDSLSSIYDTIKDDMDLRAAAQNRLLSVVIPADLPTVAADRGSVSEVMSNLIDNAIKYSNEGGQVTVSAKPDGDFVKLIVEDRGIGMPSNVVSNLFHKFYRSHRSRETVAGTGIGLYISKAIIESHGGTIGVRSVEGQGSTFEFSLPIYATVADKIKAGDNTNEGLINQKDGGWIKNHSMFRG